MPFRKASSVLLLALGILFLPQTSELLAAGPKIKTNWKYYKIQGTTASELIREMKRKGPRGFWAYARWYVKWTGNCRVTVTLNYTFPQWTNQYAAPAGLQAEWRKMTAALKRHEENHGKHGVNAGREILASGCKNGNKIIAKWAKEDKNYDLRTKHGRKEGVKL